MRILLLTHTFNSLTQRFFVELTERGHEVSVEFDINDAVTVEAVALFRPDLIIAPYLRRAIPEAVWKHHTCIVIHPGIVGDRGPSALDWAILEGERRWGVTALQANAVMDGGDIWASAEFPMRLAKKSSLYRNEVTEAAVRCLEEVLARFGDPGFRPTPLDYGDPAVRGRLRPLMRQADRRIDWQRDTTETVLRKIHAADGNPGVLDRILGREFFLYDAHPEDELRGAPGELIARRHQAVCRATVEGAVWIGHLRERPPEGERSLKLPALTALGEVAVGLPEAPLAIHEGEGRETYREITYREEAGVGYLAFEFYNGAMSTEQCRRLLEAYRYALTRPTRVLVLLGGRDFWSNGIHLNIIEQAESPADESWRNINAIDDVAQAIIETDDRITIAALRGNAGAGGVFLALAADRVYAREGVVLNPHYKSMGNLYGSEYWTYLLPRRVGAERAAALTRGRLPVGARQEREIGLLDDCFGHDVESFERRVSEIARQLAADEGYDAMIAAKRARRAADEAEKPLAAYRAEELEQMKLNFYGFDPSYHVARYHFVYKVPHSRTPYHLAIHRRLGYRNGEAA
ncbi:MAG: hydrogenase maturation protein [Gammaproteobacteria bacterium]